MREDDLFLLLVIFIHREIIDIAEAVRILLTEIQPPPELRPDLPRIEARLFFLISDEENGISRHKARQLCHLFLHLLRYELVDRSLVAAVLHHFQITEAAHADGLGKLQELLVEAFGHFFGNLDGPDRLPVERLEAAPLEEFCHIDDAERVAQIRLIRTERKHGLGVADHRKRRLCHRPALRRKLPEGIGEHLFAHPEHILLGGKTHLKIQLIKLSRRPVGSCILIPKTRGILKIFIKAGYHQKLLVLLRSLRQRIELTFIFAGRHDIVPGSLRRGSAQNRRLNLQKSKFRHLLPQITDDSGTEDHVALYFAVSEIQIAVLQAGVLMVFL